MSGTPSVATGLDGAAYLAVRDQYSGLWTARVQGSIWTGWKFGGGILHDDPSIAAAKDGMLLVAVNGQAALWHRALEEGAEGDWRPWTPAAGTVETVKAVALGRKLSIAATDAQKNLWWFDIPTSNWDWRGQLPTSNVNAAPR